MGDQRDPETMRFIKSPGGVCYRLWCLSDDSAGEPCYLVESRLAAEETWKSFVGKTL